MAHWKLVYLSLGSNLGDRAARIAQAVEHLGASGVRTLRQSSLYLTEAVGEIEQGLFLNCVVEADTKLMPLELLRAVLRVERKLGRRRLVAGGPRTIDIDILFYGSSVVSTPELSIPHPRLGERLFVLVPLNEVAPGLRHPLLGRTVAELLAETGDRSAVRVWRTSKAAAKATDSARRQGS